MADVKRTLRMKFNTDEDKLTTISLSSCKDGITAPEAHDAMDAMIANDTFTVGLEEKAGASVAELKVTTLF
jgi:hypothetical protein